MKMRRIDHVVLTVSDLEQSMISLNRLFEFKRK
jgi:hypothetical protein